MSSTQDVQRRLKISNMVQHKNNGETVLDESCSNEIFKHNEESGKETRGDYLSSQDLRPLNTEPIESEHEELKAPDGGWGWFVVLGCFLVHFLMGGFERSSGVIYLQLLSKYKRSATATAWVLSIFSTLRLVLGPVASVLCNRYSCRFVVMLGAGISAIAVLISGFITDIPYMYLTYGVLLGIGRALVYTPSIVAVGQYFNKRRGIAVGLSTSGIGFGCFLFPPTIEVLFNYYGFSWTFVILSAVISNFFVCGSLFRPLQLHWKLMEYDRKKEKGIIHEESPGQVLLSKSVAKTKTTVTAQISTEMNSSMDIYANVKIETMKMSLFTRKISQVKLALKNMQTPSEKKPLFQWSLFKNFAFCALCIQLLLFTFSINITSLFLPALARERGVSSLEGAYLVSIIGICDGLSRIINSTLLDLKRVKPYRLFIYNMIMFFAAIVSVLLPSMTTFWQFAIVSGLYGILSGTYMSQKSVVIVDVLGVSSLSSAFGFLMLAQGISNLIGSTVGGMFKDFLGSYDMAFYFGSIGIVSGGLMMAVGNIWLYKQKKQMQRDEERG